MAAPNVPSSALLEDIRKIRLQRKFSHMIPTPFAIKSHYTVLISHMIPTQLAIYSPHNYTQLTHDSNTIGYIITKYIVLSSHMIPTPLAR